MLPSLYVGTGLPLAMLDSSPAVNGSRGVWGGCGFTGNSLCTRLGEYSEPLPGFGGRCGGFFWSLGRLAGGGWSGWSNGLANRLDGSGLGSGLSNKRGLCRGMLDNRFGVGCGRIGNIFGLDRHNPGFVFAPWWAPSTSLHWECFRCACRDQGNGHIYIPTKNIQAQSKQSSKLSGRLRRFTSLPFHVVSSKSIVRRTRSLGSLRYTPSGLLAVSTAPTPFVSGMQQMTSWRPVGSCEFSTVRRRERRNR